VSRTKATPLIVVLVPANPGNWERFCAPPRPSGDSHPQPARHGQRLEPKAVRASAGSVFGFRCWKPAWKNVFPACTSRRQNLDDAVHGAEPATASTCRPVALLIGNEGNGVPQRWLSWPMEQ